MDIHYLFQLTIYIYISSSDALDTNQEVKKSLTGKMQFLPGQTEIHWGLTPEARSPNSQQLQRICLNNIWAETLQELWDFVPETFSLYQPLLMHTWQSHPKEMDTVLFLVFSQPNSLDLA